MLRALVPVVALSLATAANSAPDKVPTVPVGHAVVLTGEEITTIGDYVLRAGVGQTCAADDQHVALCMLTVRGNLLLADLRKQLTTPAATPPTAKK